MALQNGSGIKTILQHRRKHFRASPPSPPSSSYWSANSSILNSYDNYLVAAYKMEDGALTADSKGSNTLTNNNGVVSSSEGKNGYCGVFNTYDTHLSVSSPDFLPTTSMAVSWWYNPGQEIYELQWISSFEGWFYNWWCDFFDSDITSYAILQSDGTLVIEEITQGYTPSTWYHMLMIADGTALKLYINGVQKGSSQPYDGTIQSINAPFRIGTNEYGNEPLNNKIDELYFWKNIVIDTGATDAFASALYNNGNGAFWSP